MLNKHEIYVFEKNKNFIWKCFTSISFCYQLYLSSNFLEKEKIEMETRTSKENFPNKLIRILYGPVKKKGITERQ